MTSPAPQRTAPELSAPGDLIAAIPGLLGFPPDDSIVLVGFTEAGEKQVELASAMRTDLPPPEDVPGVAGQLCFAMRGNGADLAAAVVVSAGADPPALPHRDLIQALDDLLDEHGIQLVHSAWVAATVLGQTWWCYCDDECTGQVPDPRDSPFAVAWTPSDAPIFASRDEMAAQLAPDPEDQLAHRAELLAADRRALAGEVAVDTYRTHLREMLDATARATGPPALDDAQLARLGAALSHPDVRDHCFVTMLDEHPTAAERLWTVLTKALPAPERAEPACLLAMHAYLRGEGVLAGMALDAAVEASPDHRLAWLLRATIDTGTPPESLRRLLAMSISEAGKAAPVSAEGRG